MLEIKNLSLLVVGLCVAGCQTTGGGMDTSEARLAKKYYGGSLCGEPLGRLLGARAFHR